MRNKHFSILLFSLLSIFFLGSLISCYLLLNKLDESKAQIEILTKQLDSYRQNLLQDNKLNNNLKLEKLRLSLEKYIAEEPHANKKNGSKLSAPENFYPDFLPVAKPYKTSRDFNEKHKALDFAGKLGTSVFAGASGVVEKAEADTYFGKTIIINHLNGFKTVYAHLDSICVNVETFVKKGQTIGSVGNSGYSTNPHLHYEIQQSDINQNPKDFIKNFKGE